MTSMQERVAVRLVRLCLRPDGTLPGALMLADATRAALLCDLALDGGLTMSADQLEFDPTPTGFPPADNLLAAIAAVPDKSLEWWLHRGPDSLQQLIGELVADGTWTRHGLLRRYRDTQPGLAESDRHRIRRALHGRRADPATNILASIADVTVGGRFEKTRWSTVQLDFGQAGWLVPDVVSHLVRRRGQLDIAAFEGQSALNTNYLI